MLKSGDQVLVLAHTKNMRKIESYLCVDTIKPHNIIIMGGSLAGYYLAEQLEKHNPKLNVKILEDDYEKCEELALSLEHTTIIHSAGSNFSLYEDENVSKADVFIAVTEDDKENLFSCVLARNMGARKTIAYIRGSEYAAMLEIMGVDKVVSPSRLTADTILRFIDRKRILSLTRFDDMSGQIMEFVIPENAKCEGVPLKELGFPRQALICMIFRGDKHIIARGVESINAGDTVIIFTVPSAIHEVEKILLSTWE